MRELTSMEAEQVAGGEIVVVIGFRPGHGWGNNGYNWDSGQGGGGDTSGWENEWQYASNPGPGDAFHPTVSGKEVSTVPGMIVDELGHQYYKFTFDQFGTGYDQGFQLRTNPTDPWETFNPSLDRDYYAPDENFDNIPDGYEFRPIVVG